MDPGDLVDSRPVDGSRMEAYRTVLHQSIPIPSEETPYPVSAAFSRSRLTLCCILSLAALGSVGCGSPGDNASEVLSEPPKHVFFLTVDTLRADRMGYHGYPRDTTPRLDALAAEGVVFERAIAQWPKTGVSFASMFTGQHPQTTGLTHKAALRVPEQYLTLPEWMEDQGYRGLAVVSNGVLGKRLGWDAGFTEYWETWKLAPEPSDDPAEYRKYLNAARVNELALPMLDAHKDAEHLFVWLHYSDPHAPYLLPDGVENPFLGDAWYTDTSEVKLDNPRATRLGDHRELRYYEAAYDANVRFVDDHVGRVLDHARELGLLENALIVFTADHGESLGEHEYWFGHGRLPYNQGSWVPLFFHWPGHVAEGRRFSAPVELVDLFPTFQDLTAPSPPVPGLEGKSLWPHLTDPPATIESGYVFYAFAEAGGGSPTTHYRNVQDDRWKLIYHPALGKQPEWYELYDLQADPGETENLFTEDHPEARRLARVLRGWMKGSDWIRKDQEDIESQSEETLRALRALGYAD